MRFLISVLAFVALSGTAGAAPQALFESSDVHPVRQTTEFQPDHRMVHLSTLSGFVRDSTDLSLKAGAGQLLLPDPDAGEKISRFLTAIKPVEAGLASSWRKPGFGPLLPRVSAATHDATPFHSVPLPASAQMLLASVMVFGTFRVANRSTARRARLRRTQYRRRRGR